jgi:hypothetical protein
MKLNVPVLALAATTLGTLAANAQAMIEERHDPAVVIEHDSPSVTVKERGVVGEKKVIKRETTGMGDCTSKTLHKEDETGSKIVQKINCG